MGPNGIVCVLGKGASKLALKGALELRHRAREGFAVSYGKGFERLKRLELEESGFVAIAPLGGIGSLSDEALIHGIHSRYRQFSLCKFSENGLEFSRDRWGTRPLFYHFGEVKAVASEPKALRTMGLEAREVEPGFTYKMDQELKIERMEEKEMEIEMDPVSIISLLKESVEHLGRVALAFSGGLDSSILASVLSDRAVLISVYTPGSEDEERCPRVAKELGLEFFGVEVDRGELALLDQISRIVERDSAMDLAIALTLNLTARKAEELGLEVLVIGQLADELFGGYKKYIEMANKDVASAESMMVSDVLNAYRLTFDRDEPASSPHTFPYFPYAYHPLVRLALSLPIRMKIREGNGKLILRDVAKLLGLPKHVVEGRKRALQYSTRLERVVKVYLKEKLRG